MGSIWWRLALLIRQLSGVKLNDKELKEWIRHKIVVCVGDVSAPRASANIALSFEPADPKKLAGQAVYFEINGTTTATATSELLGELKEFIIPKASAVGVALRVEVDEKGNNIQIGGSPPGPAAVDPFAMSGALGLDLKKFIKELSLKLEFTNGIDAFIGSSEPDGRALMDLIGFNAELKLEVRKALFQTIATALPIPGAVEAFWATFMEQLNIVLHLGDLKEFLTGSAPVAELEEKAEVMLLTAVPEGAPNPGLAMFRAMTQARRILSDPAIKDGLRDQFASKFVVPNKKMKSRIDLVRSTIKEITSIVYHTESGVKVTITLNNFIPFGVFPSPTVPGSESDL